MFFVLANSTGEAINVFDTSDNSTEWVNNAFVVNAIKDLGIKISGITLYGGFKTNYGYQPEVANIDGISKVYVVKEYTLILYCRVSAPIYTINFLLYHKGKLLHSSLINIPDCYMYGLDSLSTFVDDITLTSVTDSGTDYIFINLLLTDKASIDIKRYCKLVYKNEKVSNCKIISKISQYEGALPTYYFDNKLSKLLYKDPNTLKVFPVADTAFK